MTPQSRFVLVGALGVVVLAAAPGVDAAPPPVGLPGPPTTAPDRRPREKVVIAGETFNLELAADPRSRQTGLMHRKSIAADGGMLFVFPRAGYRGFWMFDCLVDIDIMYLDPHGTIVATHRMKAEPPRRPTETPLAYEVRLRNYSSIKPAQYAIELKAGTIERLGLKRGQRIILEFPRLSTLARENELRRDLP